MFKVRQRSVLRPQKLEMIEINAEGVNIPLKENWKDRWCTMPSTAQELYDQIYNFEVYDDDIFVVTFPKCGTTWIQETAWLLLNDTDYSKANEIDLRFRSVYMDLRAIYNDLPFNTIELAANLPRPRLIKTHLPAFLIPHQIWTKKVKIIYCARNPKDVAVSYFHFHHGLGTWDGSINDFVDDFINDDIMYTPYWPHILDFWQMRHEPQIFFTTYENMKQDLADVIIKLNEFLDKPALSNENLKKLVEHLSFDKMKANKKTNPTENIKAGHDRVSRNFQFMRRGIAGAYRDEMTTEIQQKIDEWTSKYLAPYNLMENEIFGNFSIKN